MASAIAGGTGSHVCYWAQGVNHGALRAAYAVRNESISMRRNAVQRRPAAKTMPWLTSSSIPT